MSEVLEPTGKLAARTIQRVMASLDRKVAKNKRLTAKQMDFLLRAPAVARDIEVEESEVQIAVRQLPTERLLEIAHSLKAARDAEFTEVTHESTRTTAQGDGAASESRGKAGSQAKGGGSRGSGKNGAS